MNLKDYQEQPDSGLFEKISRRLAWRRAMRWGGAAVAVGAVAVAAILLLTPNTAEVASQPAEVATYTPDLQSSTPDLGPQAAQPAVSQVASATTQEAPAAALRPMNTAEPVVSAVLAPAADLSAGEVEEILAEVLPVQPMHAAVPSVEEPVAVATSDDFRDAPEPVRTQSKGSVPEEPVPHYDNLLWAPNIIVPDGDFDNRLFRVVANSEMTEYHLYIYNRNGRQIFNTNDPNATWDATYEGARLPQGAYVWVAKFRDSNGAPRVEKGTVTVVR